jgi:hypothetical protein
MAALTDEAVQPSTIGREQTVQPSSLALEFGAMDHAAFPTKP